MRLDERKFYQLYCFLKMNPNIMGAKENTVGVSASARGGAGQLPNSFIDRSCLALSCSRAEALNERVYVKKTKLLFLPL